MRSYHEWCSAAWLVWEGGNTFVKTVNSFKIDQVKVYDENGSKALSSQRAPKPRQNNMECSGPKGGDGRSTPLSNTCAPQTAQLCSSNTP